MQLCFSFCCVASAQFVCRVSTGSIQFPTVELVDPTGCFRGVKSHNLYSPLHRHNLLATPPRISPVQILIHPDSRDHRLSREGRRLTRWQHQDSNIPPRATYLTLTGPVPPVRALCPVMATRLILRPARHPLPHRHSLLRSY